MQIPAFINERDADDAINKFKCKWCVHPSLFRSSRALTQQQTCLFDPIQPIHQRAYARRDYSWNWTAFRWISLSMLASSPSAAPERSSWWKDSLLPLQIYIMVQDEEQHRRVTCTPNREEIYWEHREKDGKWISISANVNIHQAYVSHDYCCHSPHPSRCPSHWSPSLPIPHSGMSARRHPCDMAPLWSKPCILHPDNRPNSRPDLML